MVIGAALISGPSSLIEPSSAETMAEVFSTIQSRIGWSCVLEMITCESSPRNTSAAWRLAAEADDEGGSWMPSVMELLVWGERHAILRAVRLCHKGSAPALESPRASAYTAAPIHLSRSRDSMSTALSSRYKNLQVEARGPVTVLSIHRPDVLNALNRETLG